MTFIWLIVWLASSTPDITSEQVSRAWLIALVVCLAMDIFKLND